MIGRQVAARDAGETIEYLINHCLPVKALRKCLPDADVTKEVRAVTHKRVIDIIVRGGLDAKIKVFPLKPLDDDRL